MKIHLLARGRQLGFNQREGVKLNAKWNLWFFLSERIESQMPINTGFSF